jgi:hypothetical protein
MPNINVITVTAATTLSLLLSSSVLADEVYSETAMEMPEALVQAICDGDKDRHIAMHQRVDLRMTGYSFVYDDDFAEFYELCQNVGLVSVETTSHYTEAQMQAYKELNLMSSDITMGDGAVYTMNSEIIWGTYNVPKGASPVEAWRVGGFRPQLPDAPRAPLKSTSHFTPIYKKIN